MRLLDVTTDEEKAKAPRKRTRAPSGERIMFIEEVEKDGMSGYAVTTSRQCIMLCMSNLQECSEDWGYFLTEDVPDDFIGAVLTGVSLVDTCRNVVKFDKLTGNLDEGGVMFVNLETDRGTLQFVAYNAHNGYYGHRAVVSSTQLTHEEVL